MTDIAAGAAIGIGSVHLGYFITDKIFGEQRLSDSFIEPSFHYDPTRKHYVAELIFGQRFVIGAEGQKQMGAIPVRGALAGLSTDNNFKLKAFADFESLDLGRSHPWTNTVVVGWSSAWFW